MSLFKKPIWTQAARACEEISFRSILISKHYGIHHSKELSFNGILLLVIAKNVVRYRKNCLKRIAYDRVKLTCQY